MEENNKKVDLSQKPQQVKPAPKAPKPSLPAGKVDLPSPTPVPNQRINLTPPDKPTKPSTPNKPNISAIEPKSTPANIPEVNIPSTNSTPPLPPTQPIPTVPVAENTSLETSKQSEVETLTPLKPDHSASLAQPLKPVSRWAFWKKGKQRDEQLIRISEGYVQMVDMVRSIRDQADAQYQNNLILRDSLVHLPSAIKSLEGFGKSHEQVGHALEKINEQMEHNLAKDERMANTMAGFNDTLKGMNGTTKATIQTFDRVQERMRDSDIRMENLFSNVRQSEEKVSETMTRLQRNMSIFQAFFLLCLLGIIGGLIYLFINKEDFTDKSAPVEQQAVQNNDTSQALAPTEVTPSQSTEKGTIETSSDNTEDPATEIVPAEGTDTVIIPTEEGSNDIVPADILPADLAPEDIQPDVITEEPTTETPAIEEPTNPDPIVEPQVEEPQAEEPTLEDPTL